METSGPIPKQRILNIKNDLSQPKIPKSERHRETYKQYKRKGENNNWTVSGKSSRNSKITPQHTVILLVSGLGKDGSHVVPDMSVQNISMVAQSMVEDRCFSVKETGAQKKR